MVPESAPIRSGRNSVEICLCGTEMTTVLIFDGEGSFHLRYECPKCGHVRHGPTKGASEAFEAVKRG